jgi:hypothetical protein
VLSVDIEVYTMPTKSDLPQGTLDLLEAVRLILRLSAGGAE